MNEMTSYQKDCLRTFVQNIVISFQTKQQYYWNGFKHLNFPISHAQLTDEERMKIVMVFYKNQALLNIIIENQLTRLFNDKPGQSEDYGKTYRVVRKFLDNKEWDCFKQGTDRYRDCASECLEQEYEWINNYFCILMYHYTQVHNLDRYPFIPQILGLTTTLRIISSDGVVCKEMENAFRAENIKRKEPTFISMPPIGYVPKGGKFPDYFDMVYKLMHRHLRLDENQIKEVVPMFNRCTKRDCEVHAGRPVHPTSVSSYRIC